MSTTPVAFLRSFHSFGRIRKYLSQADTERIVHAFILSKLDYCNSLRYGIPSRKIEKTSEITEYRDKINFVLEED